MADASGKLISSGAKTFLDRPRGSSVTRTYPKSGQEQSVPMHQGDFQDSPRGDAVTVEYPKSGPNQSAG